ncbi:MAG: helix-turn-helix domain-containing protein [Ruminococcaceae bacterium]|nr:helix-turn-helix domain-containing protein [Oscillospiraceae bacterium]
MGKTRCFDTGSQLNLHFCNYKTDLWAKTIHNHDYIEIAVIVDGVGVHKINNVEIVVKKGEVCIINTESIHQFSPLEDDSSQSLSILFITIYPEFLYDMGFEPTLLNNIINMLLFKFYYVQNNKYSFILSNEELEHTVYLSTKMIEELHSNKNCNIYLLKMYLSIILIEFSRHYEKLVKATPQINNYHFALVKNVINYLNLHYFENITLKELSDYCHISSRHLSRIFKEATNFSIFEYLQKVRIEKACLLLKTTDRKITDIVNLVGFTDYRYFNKIFKNYTGMTPRKYANRKDL